MKKLILLFTLTAIAVAITSCTSPSVAISTQASKSEDNQTYSIAAFQDANGKDKAAYPDAAIVVRTAIESAFIKYGKHVVQDKGDVEITGVVTAYYRGSFFGRYTTVGINLKATDKKSGSVLWNVWDLENTKYFYDYDPTKWANKVADKLVKTIVTRSPAQQEIMSGIDFLFHLRNDGKLPGNTKDEHGNIVFNLSDLQNVSYPLSRTYQVVLTGATFTNNYTIVRVTKDSTWQLRRAWRTDSSGRVEELAVK